jgi:predicted metal-dependent phosphoesterase TrpH
MLIDLHCHTRLYSPCSALTPDALVRAARARGLDALCITEHDALWPLEDARRLAESLEFVVLRGLEVTTEYGHVLVYGATRHEPAMATLAELHRIVRSESGLMFLAHPGRGYAAPPPPAVLALFDSVEIDNGTEGDAAERQCCATRRYAAPARHRRQRLPLRA